MASRDKNHHSIVKKFERSGASVIDLSQVGRGRCDLLVGYCGVDQLVEIKLPEGKFGGTAHSRLNHRQVAFAHKWNGRVPVVVRTEHDVERLLRSIEDGGVDRCTDEEQDHGGSGSG